MKLSLQLILETLTEYGAQLIETDGDFTFTGVQILTSPTDILEPDTLYVCTPKVLPKLKKQLFENHCFVFKAKPSQLQCHHALHGILLDENTDLNEVVNRLITLFTQFHAFEFAIKEASLERRGYEPFFEIAKKAFPHCLIVVTDSAYNIVCSTRSSVDDIPYFRDLLQRGYYSREDMNQIASWGYYEDERKCVQPVLYPAEKTICGYPFLVRSYKNHGAAYCFIGCYFLDVPPTQRDISLYTCLTQELENYYKVNGIFDAGMLGKQQQLLDDLIRPKQNSPEYFHDRCAQLNIPYQGTFRIGLVQCESSTLFKVSHISNQLRAHCPLANYGVFQYGSSVIILFRDWNDANVRTQSGFSEDWNALLTTLRQKRPAWASACCSATSRSSTSATGRPKPHRISASAVIRTAPPISTRNTIWRTCSSIMPTPCPSKTPIRTIWTGSWTITTASAATSSSCITSCARSAISP